MQFPCPIGLKEAMIDGVGDIRHKDLVNNIYLLQTINGVLGWLY